MDVRITRLVPARLRRALSGSLDIPATKDASTPLRDADGIWVPQGATGWSDHSDTLDRPYEQQATVYKAVTATARNLSSVRLEFFAGDSDKALPPTHPVVKLWANPEGIGGLGQRQFVYKHAQDLELTGDWFVVYDGLARLSKGSGDFPTRLRRVPRERMEPTIERGELTGWKYKAPSGRVTPYSAEQVMHSFYPSPYADVMGVGPLQAALLEADSDYQAVLWNRYWFENDTSSGVIFTRDKEARGDPVKDRAFLDWWQARRAGVSRAGSAIITPPGVDIKERGHTQQEMSFVDLRRFSREQILAIFDVPPAVAGVFEYANYANAREQLRFFWYHKLFPMLDDLEAVIQSALLDRFGTGVRCAFKREDVQALIEDYSQKLDVASKIWGMGVPFEKINERLDLGFDTDEIPGADVGYLPFSVTPVEDMLAPPEPPSAPPPSPPPSPPDDDDEEEEEPPEPEAGARGRRITSAAVRRGRSRALARRKESLERMALGAWRKWLEWLRDEVLKDLRASYSSRFAPYGITRVVEAIGPDYDKMLAEAVASLRPAHAASVKSAFDAVGTELGIDLEFSLLDPRVVTLLDERVMAVKVAVEGAGERYREALAPGIEAGESIDKLEARLADIYRQEYSGQARAVARTETLSVFSRARMDAFSEAGVEKHEWITARDNDVRPSHRIDGQVRVVGEPFTNGLAYPHAWGAPAGEVVNCRCDTLPVVEV